MSEQRSNLFGRILLLFALLILISSSLLAQNQNTADRIYFDKGRYHKKTGWVNSLGFYTGNWEAMPLEWPLEWPDHFVMQFDYLGYKLVKPRLGLGGGVALKFSPTYIVERDDFRYFKFAEIFAYTKGYFNNKRRRLYADARLGYAKPLAHIRYYCNCNERYLHVRYTSGPTIQTGIGLEMASSKSIRTGLKLSYYQNFINRQIDVHPDYWETTSDGVIKRESSSSVLKRLVVGISLYL